MSGSSLHHFISPTYFTGHDTSRYAGPIIVTNNREELGVFVHNDLQFVGEVVVLADLIETPHVLEYTARYVNGRLHHLRIKAHRNIGRVKWQQQSKAFCCSRSRIMVSLITHHVEEVIIQRSSLCSGPVFTGTALSGHRYSGAQWQWITIIYRSGKWIHTHWHITRRHGRQIMNICLTERRNSPDLGPHGGGQREGSATPSITMLFIAFVSAACDVRLIRLQRWMAGLG